MAALSDFLKKNSIVASEDVLPLSHITQAYHLKRFVTRGVIEASPCDVFKSDKLNYFFVGRPSYKKQMHDLQAEEWELPVCFVVDFNVALNPKRVFPFDSGGFARKLYPNYISMMDLEEFEVSDVPDAPQKIIGAFFGDSKKYFKMDVKAKAEFEQQFFLEPFDAEVKALHRLADDKSAATTDDRRFSIEVQTEDPVDLRSGNLLAVIIPHIYLSQKDFEQHVTKVWKAQILTYETYSLNYAQYTYAIYDKFKNFLSANGYV